jgi:two-component system, HptB-dependent secretion and biofilm response regulator
MDGIKATRASAMKILVADDNRATLALLSKFLESVGHTVLTAEDGAEAVDRYLANTPDLVLLDITMPRMDGYEATRRIRQIAGSKWIPIVLISGLDQGDAVVHGLLCGADDYLIKPVDLRMLHSKILAFQRIVAIQAQLIEKSAELQRLAFEHEEEARLAVHVYQRSIRPEGLDDPRLQWSIRPTSVFSGDVIVASRRPGGALRFMLADAAGHGLAAAINVLPLVQIFYAMTEKDLPVSTVASELNAKLRRLMPIDRFVATLLVDVDFPTRTVEVWNGGLPPMSLFDARGRLVRELQSRHVAIGIASEAMFDASTERFVAEPGERAIAMSDGFVESCDSAGEPFGIERVRRLCGSVDSRRYFDQLLRAFEDNTRGAPPVDDVSLVSFGFESD